MSACWSEKRALRVACEGFGGGVIGVLPYVHCGVTTGDLGRKEVVSATLPLRSGISGDLRVLMKIPKLANVFRDCLRFEVFMEVLEDGSFPVTSAPCLPAFLVKISVRIVLR